MSNLQRLTTNSCRVQNYLRHEGFDVGGRGKKMNTILVDFLKKYGLPYAEWNPKYKGLFTAVLGNAVTVSEQWRLFRQYINKLKEKEQ